MGDLAEDLKSASRALARRRGSALVVVATLALGIGANTAVFSVVRGVLLRALPYPEPERLVRVYESGRMGERLAVAEANLLDWQRDARSFESLSMYSAGTTPVVGGGQAVRSLATTVSRGFFGVLGVKPALGRTLGEADARPGAEPVVVVGHGFWQRVLGGERDLSRLSLRFDGSAHAVVGVMPAGFAYPPGAELWSAREILGPPNPSRSAHNFAAIGRLRRGVEVASARAELRGLAGRAFERYGDAPNPDHMDAGDANVVSLHDALTDGARPALLVLMGAVGFLLLVACANVANLMLAEAAARRQELAVRAALGASRGRLFRQFLGEGLLLALAGGAAGVGLAALGTRGLLRLAGGRLPRGEEIAVDAGVLAFALALCGLTALLVAAVPALRRPDDDLQETLKAAGRAQSETPRGRFTREALVVSQVALTLVLLMGAGLLGRSFLALLRTDLGFETENRLVVDVVLDPAKDAADALRLASFHERLLERAARLPGVTAAGGVSQVPLSGRDGNGGFQIEGGEISGGARTPYYASFRVASPGYFGALGIPLLRGRSFEPTDGPGTPHVALISRTAAARAFPGQDPLGRRINYGNMDGYFDDWITIVGVVGDVRHSGPGTPSNGEVYLLLAQRPRATSSFSTVLAASGDPARLIPVLGALVREIDPDVPAQVRRYEEIFGAALADRRFSVWLLSAFAVTAALLALLGIYGVMAYGVERRTREIGIRMALGATPREVLALILSDAGRLVALGLGLGLAGAFASGRLIESQLVGVSPYDPLALATVSLALGASALLASLGPARRAALVDPVISLQGSRAPR
jgi:putative ABC transport system permease protein